MRTQTSDEALLLSPDPEAFGHFYVRHLEGVTRYFARRVPSDTAADLAAETFASAVVARKRFVPGDTPAAGWLYTIAARRYVDHQRRHTSELRATEAVASEPSSAGASELPPSLLLSELHSGLLRNLPPEQREAIAAHVLQGLDYADIASASGSSEPSVRQRVSRGLRALRAPLEVYRAAQDLAREGRGYRFGAGHGTALGSIGPRAPLDCSSAASLILQHGGVFDSSTAWTSTRLADRWGAIGEGQYVTLWANDEHVWLEFKLDADHGERFDPTPSHLAPNAGWLSTRKGPTADYTPRHWPGL